MAFLELEGSIDIRRAATVANDRGATRAELRGTRRASEKAARAADMVNDFAVEWSGTKLLQRSKRP